MNCSAPKTITVDGVEYVQKEAMAMHHDGLPFVVIRATSAGVFAGWLKSRNGQECEMVDARRLWYWAGAASLSQLAMEGVKRPDECKFPQIVPEIVVIGVIEIIPATITAQKSISEVPVWKR